MENDKSNNITSKEIYDYCKRYSSKPSTELSELEQETTEKIGQEKMLTGAFLGRTLSLLSKMLKPNRILEIGTFTGYGTINLASGLQTGGKIITIEINESLKDFAAPHFKKAGIENKVIQIIGDASKVINSINEEFDLVFIDAAKRQYIDYYELVLPKLKSGGIIIADNVLWKGLVTSEDIDKLGEGLDAFNKHVAKDDRVESVLLPIDDGINLIRKK